LKYSTMRHLQVGYEVVFAAMLRRVG